jgi:hypothetical protein
MAKFDGMTVNERLYVSGLIYQFDLAVKNNELDKLKNILSEVELDESSIEEIIKTLK